MDEPVVVVEIITSGSKFERQRTGDTPGAAATKIRRNAVRLFRSVQIVVHRLAVRSINHRPSRSSRSLALVKMPTRLFLSLFSCFLIHKPTSRCYSRFDGYMRDKVHPDNALSARDKSALRAKLMIMTIRLLPPPPHSLPTTENEVEWSMGSDAIINTTHAFKTAFSLRVTARKTYITARHTIFLTLS